MAEQEAIGLLEQLARDFNVRDPRKLFQIARREFPDRRDLTSARAAAALRGDVAEESGEERGGGAQRPAASGPGGLLSEHQRAEQVRLVQDVFTRKIATKALPDKRAETVMRAAAEIIPDLVQEEGNYVVTTDLGNEFRGLEALPGRRTPGQRDGGRGPGDTDAKKDRRAWWLGGGAAGASTWTRRRRPATPGRTRR